MTLLKLWLPEGVVLVGFADYVGLMTTNHTSEGIETTTNLSMSMVGTWIKNHSLELLHAKTEAVTAKWAYRQPVIYFGGVQVVV